MRSIIKTSLAFRYLVLILAATIMVFGILQLREMPVDVLPEFSPPYVEIQTEALGLSAEEVEQMITVPMEQDLLAGVAWLDVIRSESVPGLSSVLIYFEPGTDIFKARQMVAERLAQAAVGLPHVSKPPTMIQPLSSTSRFMIVGLSSDQLSLIQMSVLARWTIAPRLMGVPGVAHVAIWGNRDRQLQVLVDPEKLQDAGVTLQQIVDTTGNALWVSSLTYLEASTPGTGGFIDTPQQRLGIWHVLPISSPSELAQVPLQKTAYRLGDVTNVVEDHQPLIGDAIINESPNLLLVIEKLPGMNTLELTQGIEATLDALRPGFAEINFDATLFRPATYIEMAFANIGRTLLISAVLIILGLLVFQWNWRATLVSIIAIPLSLIAALSVLYLRGETLNTMVLVGLAVALGVVIDEAIIDIDRILTRLRKNNQEAEPDSNETVILDSGTKTRSAVFFVTLIILLVVLPVFFIEGATGTLVGPLVSSYMLAVLAAMLVAMLVTPVVSFILFSIAPVKDSESPVIGWIRNIYAKMLEKSVHKPWLVYTAGAILLVAGIALLPFLDKKQVLPSFAEPYLNIQIEAKPGVSLPAMRETLIQATHDLQDIPGIRDVAAHVGRAVFGDRVVSINSAELWVSINPEADYSATVNQVRQAMEGYTELKIQVQTNLDQVMEQLEPENSNLVAVRIFGESFDTLHSLADQMQAQLAGISGISNPQVVLPEEEQTIEIEVNLDDAQRFGVKPGDVRRTAAILLSGIQVGSLFEQQKVFDVVVWGIPEIRDNPEDIGNLLIDTPGGGHARLSEIADVRMVNSPTTIKREGVSPYLDITFNIQGRSSKAVTSEIKNTILGFPFPLEYHAELINNLAVRQASQLRILIAAIVALVGIFLLLQASFRSWHLAGAVLLILPAALSGGVIAAFLGSRSPLTISLLCGLLTIFGITVRHITLLIKHYQELEDQTDLIFGPQLILQGAIDQMPSYLTSILTTGLALLPFVIFGNVPGNEMLQPISSVVLGGLVTTILVNLFVFPSLYLRLGLNREPDLKLEPASATD